jgi:hypothetical protein
MDTKIKKGYRPAKPPRLTPAEFQDLGHLFQKLSDSKPLRAWIVAAGIGAILEGVHVVWLAGRFLLGR